MTDTKEDMVNGLVSVILTGIPSPLENSSSKEDVKEVFKMVTAVVTEDFNRLQLQRILDLITEDVNPAVSKCWGIKDDPDLSRVLSLYLNSTCEQLKRSVRRIVPVLLTRIIQTEEQCKLIRETIDRLNEWVMADIKAFNSVSQRNITTISDPL